MSNDLLAELTQHRGRMKRWLVAFGVPTVDAEDVTQEVLSAAVRYISTYDPAKGALTSWLKQIARNEAKRYFRERGEPPPELLAEYPIAAETPERKAFDSEMERALSQVLDNLEASERELLSMRFFEGLSNVEISTLLSIPEATVRTRLFRTLERCREGFEALGVKDSPGSLLVPLLLASQKRDRGGEGSYASAAASPPRPSSLVRRVLESRWTTFAAGGALVYLLLHGQSHPDLLACGVWPRMMPISLECRAIEGDPAPAAGSASDMKSGIRPAKTSVPVVAKRPPEPLTDFSSQEGAGQSKTGEVGKGHTNPLRR